MDHALVRKMDRHTSLTYMIVQSKYSLNNFYYSFGKFDFSIETIVKAFNTTITPDTIIDCILFFVKGDNCRLTI